MKTPTRRIGTLAAAATLALTLAACSSDESAAEADEVAPFEQPQEAEETTEPEPEVLPDPEHGEEITAAQAADLPEHLAAVEVGDGTLIAVDGTQPFPDAVVAHIQDLIPVTPVEQYDMEDIESNHAEQDRLREAVVEISEATGRRPATVVNAGRHNEEGVLVDDSSWLPQLHSELSELMLANQAEDVITITFHPTADEAIAQLEDLIADLDDPSVWEVIPPRS